jgi:hypothetical protein
MFRRFLVGADEWLPWLAETKANLSVHIVGMELNLNGLTNDAIHISGFSGTYGVSVKLNAVSQVDGVFSYSWLVWMFKMYVPLMLLQPVSTERISCRDISSKDKALLAMCFNGIIQRLHDHQKGERSSVVGWGTMLQAGRLWDQVPMRWIFSIYLILPATLWTWGQLSL